MSTERLEEDTRTEKEILLSIEKKISFGLGWGFFWVILIWMAAISDGPRPDNVGIRMKIDSLRSEMIEMNSDEKLWRSKITRELEELRKN